MPARLGIDFDNTIVCYDQVFHEAAVAQGLLADGPALSKREVKRQIVQARGEACWTGLQGLVYGPLIHQARPTEGVRSFLRQASAKGWMLSVVSHKTRHPLVGEAYDLHRAARDWLEAKGFHELGLGPEQVYFEPSREAKVSRLSGLGCRIFIDDLPEVFLEPSFPTAIDRWLYFQGPEPDGPWRVFSDWSEPERWLSTMPGGR